MRRAVGIGGLRRKEAERQALSRKGNELAQREIEKLQEQISLMKDNLEVFVREHQKDIRNNPVFRVQVQRMCQLIGVDPLASRKGYLAELLGVGDFYCELGIQIIDICVATRSMNGGLMDLDELRERLIRRRLKGSEPVVEDDIRRAINQLKPLSGGYRIVTFGKRKMVQSVAREMNSDQSTVLTLAEYTSKFNIEDVRVAFGWDEDRIHSCIDDMLRSGIIWIDSYNDAHPEYWVPAFFSQLFGGNFENRG
ncbi:ESCRT II complex subunit Dot2 [Coemansia sp. RSA 2703]|nr:ESCRT II complex subunit Dot2 [Coemansia sp. RSA 2703]KAJ1842614.1 ESCRT II complex subunit Dot2 [Coemansia sp. RSA 2703]KAJ2376786.1 ESCRT II complex subunit Dot2 [Coemansia sp. RSA 2607]KAJ2378893.1 ESCRT II complex subunit Dot2 [Coemansia sp. RSA 2607]KAJ2388909.1 ESCRT II complex subunit Dot2 [Coemansia sp. RSA 2603]